MNFMNLFLVACFYVSIPIIYIMMRNNTIPKKGLILSVTLPPEAQKDPEVTDYVEKFRKTALIHMLILPTITILPALLFSRTSVILLWLVVWLLAVMFWQMWIYGKGYKGLKAIKHRRGWVTKTASQTVAELSPLKLPKPVKAGWFVPPMILSILPVISCFADEIDPGWKIFLMVIALSCLFITVLSFALYTILFRARADVSDTPDRTAALIRIRRYNWTKAFLVLTWATGLWSLAIWIAQGRWFMTLTLIYTAVIILVTMLAEFTVRRAQHRVTVGAQPVVDEDDYWIWGQFYYNPNSKKVFVTDRVGMNMSMNFATPAGKAMIVFSLVILVGMIPLAGWMIAEETTPVTMTYTETTLTVNHNNTRYVIDFEDVTHAALLEKLPPTYKTVGSNYERLFKGQFSVEGVGLATLCLDPTNPPYLLLETAEKAYLLGGEEAEAVYEMIK